MRTINQPYMFKWLVGCLLGFGLLLLGSCCGECKHRNDGLAVYPTWSDVTDKDIEVKDAKLWIYDAETGSLVEQKQYGGTDELAGQRFVLDEGNYLVLTTVNMTEPFTLGETTRVSFWGNISTRASSDWRTIKIGLTNPTDVKNNAYFGVTEVKIDNKGDNQVVNSPMKSMLAELTIIIEGVPRGSEMMGRAYDCALCLFPLQKNGDGDYGLPSLEPQEVELPTMIATESTLQSEIIRLMPTRYGGKASYIKLHLLLPNETVQEFEITAPVMKSGGKYEMRLKYEEMQPYMWLYPVTINDWTEGWVYKGEILSPEP